MKTVNVEEREMQNVSENSLDLINQGCALMAQQQYEQALAKFLLAQKDSPKYIDCYVNLKEVKRMAIYVEREGIEACITKIQNAIEQLQAAASEIDKTMGDLPTYWQGAAYDKAATTYIDEYQTLLTKTVPDSVDSFKQFINGCKDTIIDIDIQLSGQ